MIYSWRFSSLFLLKLQLSFIISDINLRYRGKGHKLIKLNQV